MGEDGQPLIIGTRGSRLALWQAGHIRHRLKENGQATGLRIIKTRGDQVQDLSFDKLEGKGFFTKEIEAELLAGTIDMAVHSCKDLETREPEGLHIAAIAGRGSCEELLITRTECVDRSRAMQLREGAVVGTSSARRKSQLRMFRPDLWIENIRGNVPTRVDKLRDGAFDAILLARAGIDRLGLDLSAFHVQTLDPRWFVPAPAQGALAVQTRVSDARTLGSVNVLSDESVAPAVALERAVLFGYRGGCQVPLGVHVRKDGPNFSLWASASRTWEQMPRRIHLSGRDANALAAEAVERLQGPVKPLRVAITREVHGDELLARVLRAHGMPFLGIPLLRCVPVAFALPGAFDRAFFTSRNAVRSFVQGGGSLHEVPCDAIGTGTAEELRKLGAEPVFVGDGPDTPAIAALYAQRFGHQRVLFPCATDGLRTVQRAMPASNAIDLHVYAMEAIDKGHPPPADVVILTSPAHAAAFFSSVQGLVGVSPPLFIAMGTSTAALVKERCGRDAVIPWSSNEMALIDAVFSVATDGGSPDRSNT